MTTSMLAYGKANACGNLRSAGKPGIQHYLSRTRRYGSSAAAAPQLNSNGNGKPSKPQHDPVPQRELFMDILSANATRRDAKQYLARFKSPKTDGLDGQSQQSARKQLDEDHLQRIGIDLGGLYVPSRAIADAAKFVREDVDEKAQAESHQTLHVALVCLRAPDMLDDATVEGLAVTLSQLVKLDMRIVLVLDSALHQPSHGSLAVKTAFAQQAQRLSVAISKHSPQASQFVPTALGRTESGEAHVLVPEQVCGPLKRGMIPIVPALAYTKTGQLIKLEVGDAMAALTEAMSGGGAEATPSAAKQPTISVSLDRLIVLDPAGGVPSKDRSDHAHVFINLEQEYDGIFKELSHYVAWDDGVSSPNMFEQHKANLSMLKRCLNMLPSASSALIISPQEAAASSLASQTQQDVVGAGTRRQKNTLIHNLLTNKPMVSSSLPAARLSTSNTTAPTSAATATLVKRGMPVAIIPAADRQYGWLPPETGTTDLDLQNDPRVDFPRLLYLIENSFRRKLDVEHYMSRIRGRTAGLIVAGAYEGAAILTWETPPSSPTNTSPTRLVPYLDKFAVLQSSQGSSGVADILFQSMVRTCFPQGVCWRSRKDNPVNKWYFERAAGSWGIPGTQWTLFWTGEGVVEDKGRWGDYVGVCESVEPSWAGGGRPD